MTPQHHPGPGPAGGSPGQGPSAAPGPKGRGEGCCGGGGTTHPGPRASPSLAPALRPLRSGQAEVRPGPGSPRSPGQRRPVLPADGHAAGAAGRVLPPRAAAASPARPAPPARAGHMASPAPARRSTCRPGAAPRGHPAQAARTPAPAPARRGLPDGRRADRRTSGPARGVGRLGPEGGLLPRTGRTSPAPGPRLRPQASWPRVPGVGRGPEDGVRPSSLPRNRLGQENPGGRVRAGPEISGLELPAPPGPSPDAPSPPRAPEPAGPPPLKPTTRAARCFLCGAAKLHNTPRRRPAAPKTR